MADEDIYASDTDPYEAPSLRIQPKAPDINEERAQGYLRQYDDKAKAHGATYEDIMKRRASAVAQIQRQLDGTIQEMRDKRSGAGPGQVNLPLLALGAGLLEGSPAGTAGNFGQDLGRGLSGMGNAITRQRMSDSDFLKGVAELQTKSGQLGDVPLRDQAQNEQRQQMAADAQKSRLEVALTRAGASGAGKDPVLVKEMKAENEARVAKGLPPLSPSEWYEWKSKTGGDKNTPADLRLLAEENKARAEKNLPPMSPSEWVEYKNRVGARGKEEGKETATAAVALPVVEQAFDNILDTVKKVAEHKGLPKAVGTRAMIPSIPGSDAYNFEAQLGVLKSQAFLAKVQDMRGLGALTEAEGKKIEGALASLDPKQSPEQFKQQLKSVTDLIEKNRAVARQKATGPAPMAGAKRAPNGDWVIEKDGKWFKVE